VAYTPDGKLAQLPDGVTGEPVIGPGGKNWAWIDATTGLLEASLGGAAAQPVSEVSAARPTWSPDGQTLFFFGDDRLLAGDPLVAPPKPVTPPVKLGDSDRVEWVEK
jgi:WD40-like Beta Propeller Repeat